MRRCALRPYLLLKSWAAATAAISITPAMNICDTPTVVWGRDLRPAFKGSSIAAGQSAEKARYFARS